MKAKALYILGDQERIYGPEQQATIAELVDVIGPPLNAENAQNHPDLLADVEIIFSGWGAPKLDEAFLDACPKLAAFFYGAGSVRSFTTDAFWQRKILLTSSYAANAVPVSEYAISTILLSLRGFWRFSHSIKVEGAYPEDSEKQQMAGGYGATVGLISLGMIGRLVAERLKPFDLRVIAYDPFATDADAANLGVELVGLSALFEQSDVVSLHTPWLPETEGMITGDLLRRMKRGATFINTARGAIVNEAELIETMQRRRDLWAILDVTYPEPPETGSPLYTLPNVILTPHIAGSHATECWRMGQYAVDELKAYLAGEPLQWEIDEEKARLLA